MIKQQPERGGSIPVSAETHALGSKRIGDFEPLPEHQRRGPTRPTTLVDQLLNPAVAIETGTFTLESGYQRDISEDERAEMALKIQHARNNAPRTAWLPGQREEL